MDIMREDSLQAGILQTHFNIAKQNFNEALNLNTQCLKTPAQPFFKRYLTPSFLALSALAFLNTPMQAKWIIIKNDTQTDEVSSGNVTISGDITLNKKNTAIYTQGNTDGNLTINDGVTISGPSLNRGIEVNTAGSGNRVGDIINNGTIKANQVGIAINRSSSARSIIIGSGAVVSGGQTGIRLGQRTSVGKVEIAGQVTSNSQYAFHNGGSISSLTIKAGGSVKGMILNSKAENGIIDSIVIESGASVTGIAQNGKVQNIQIDGTITDISMRFDGSYTGSIKIGKTGEVKGAIDIEQTIKNDIVNEGTINAINFKSGNGQGNLNGNLINSGQSATIKSITLDNNSKIMGNIINKDGATFSGSITTSRNSTLGGIQNKENSTFDANAKITLKGSVGTISNSGTFDSAINVDSGRVDMISNSSTFNGKINATNNASVETISNSGEITSEITANNGTINRISNSGEMESIKLENNGILNTLSNAGTLKAVEIANTAKLETLVNSGTIKEKLTNQGELTQLANSGILENGFESQSSKETELINDGNIKGGITNAGAGELTLTNSGNIDDVTNNANLNFSNTGKVTGAITNTGELALTNFGTIAEITNTSGNFKIGNAGLIEQGITNNGGKIELENNFIRLGDGGDKLFEFIGRIGKNADGVQITNNNAGEVSMPYWYFRKPEYLQEDERKDHSLIVGGDNIAGISIDKVYINARSVEFDKIYYPNTLIADKDGNPIGDKINQGGGLNADNVESITGIIEFGNYGGGMIARVNPDKLSGGALAQSLVYSQKMRNVNLSRFLRDAATQAFKVSQSVEPQKEYLASANSDFLQQNFVPRTTDKKNQAFVMPYYQRFSVELGKNKGELKSDSAGLLMSFQRALENDWGALGVYAGFDDMTQEVLNQGLDIDGKSYYGGLIYYNSFKIRDLTSVFFSATTKIDYIQRHIEKHDLVGDAISDSDVYGYGANFRVGLNQYLKNGSQISPQIGLNYLGMHSKPFTLTHLDIKEHYFSRNFNFLDLVASIRWESAWKNSFKTSFAVGGIYNAYKDAEYISQVTAREVTNLARDVDVIKFYGVAQAGITYNVLDNADISLGYSGIFTKGNKASSHSLMLRYAWWW